ncbi:hypothetical protein BDR26DRAFT_899605 [Obelidium mucronatum]|nr:hypothetical protein BDR26DRAFT_899605 [Obelidium mucronatum]
MANRSTKESLKTLSNAASDESLAFGRAVWYYLTDEEGKAYQGVGADTISIRSEVGVADLRKEVWKENKLSLEAAGIDAPKLKVYSSKEDITDCTKQPLEFDVSLEGMGKERTTSLYVVVPKKTSPPGSLESLQSRSKDVDVRWKDEVPRVHYLENGSLHFVNRTDAIKQLQTIHQSKFYRAVSTIGAEWIIPIADNDFGLGKSAFGRLYIHKSRETWPNVAARNEFQKTLCGCHTVAIEFRRGALLTDSFDAVMIELLSGALKDMFDTPPAILSKPPKTARDFLKDLTDVCGPVFIVLDEIGKAFLSKELNDFQQRDEFLRFSEDILDAWLPLKNVFFVVLGRSSYLNYLGVRPLGIAFNRLNFERLNIHRLRPKAIEEIMERTLISSAGTDTISTRLGLTPELSQVVANHLFFQTNGHPRSLLTAFKKCKSYDEILQLNEPPEMPDWEQFYDKLALDNFKGDVVRLLKYAESGTEVNLREVIKDAGGRNLTLDSLAYNSNFGWDGTIEKARLFVHPFVKTYMESYLLPFREYIQHVGNFTRVSVNYANVFEWMFLKRFQDMFSHPQSPGLVLPKFFKNANFGTYQSVIFSSFVRPMPRITKLGSQKTMKMNSSTIHPDCWPKLLDRIMPGPICLKPLPKSSSSDAILIGSATDQSDSIVLTIGLAVKNYGRTAFSWAHLSQECRLFDRMFHGTPRKGHRRVLFICCTHYDSKVMAESNEGGSFVYHSDDHPNIDEIILLNLNNKNLRQEFFGVGVGSELSGFVENVVEKAEVEYQQV